MLGEIVVLCALKQFLFLIFRGKKDLSIKFLTDCLQFCQFSFAGMLKDDNVLALCNFSMYIFILYINKSL